MAVMTKTEVLLIILGGIFVIEALSVLIQVFSFQTFRKRVFLMAPIHHHFELQAWSETKIILRFWIVAAVCSAIGFTLYQQSVAATCTGAANLRSPAGGLRRLSASRHEETTTWTPTASARSWPRSRRAAG